jgi:hypothetical protein
MFIKILACIDGSEPSLDALTYAVDLSLKYSSKLIVLSAVEEMKFPFLLNMGYGRKRAMKNC